MCRKAEVVGQGAGAGSHWCLGRGRGPLDAPSPVNWILEKDHQTAATTLSRAQGFLLCMAAKISYMGSIILSKKGRLGMQTQKSMSNEKNFDQNSNPTQPLAIF